MIRLKRVYDPAAPEDGARVLVDRLWPRGVSKERARLTAWMKDLGPSTELRKWFGHQPERWPEFRLRYLAELQQPQKQAMLEDLRRQAAAKTVTLLFGALDTERNEAVVIEEAVERRV